jgi:hypothetical protein
MLDTEIKVSDRVFPELRRFSKAMPEIHNFIISEIAEAFAHKEKTVFGAMFDQESGQTRESIKFFKIRRSHFRVRPGAGVNGRLNYLAIFQKGGTILPKKKASLAIEFEGGVVRLVKSVYIPPRPFVSVADEAFQSSGDADRIAFNTLDRWLTRRGL